MSKLGQLLDQYGKGELSKRELILRIKLAVIDEYLEALEEGDFNSAAYRFGEKVRSL